jgi:hypothetical protein
VAVPDRGEPLLGGVELADDQVGFDPLLLDTITMTADVPVRHASGTVCQASSAAKRIIRPGWRRARPDGGADYAAGYEDRLNEPDGAVTGKPLGDPGADLVRCVALDIDRTSGLIAWHFFRVAGRAS